MTEPELQPIYTNNAQVHPGLWDLTLDVGFQLPSGAGSPHWAARLVLPWQHVRLLADLLNQAADSYEEEIGPILAAKAPAPQPAEKATAKKVPARRPR